MQMSITLKCCSEQFYEQFYREFYDFIYTLSYVGTQFSVFTEYSVAFNFHHRCFKYESI